MIKIFIDNEEVVCSNQLEIKEQILSTSSTILNNCYPKSWEDNKDYVSRFYFPKDYSICKIMDNDNLIFAGVVENTGNISLNPREAKYCSLQILDFKTLLSEGETLDFVINNKTIKEAIQMIVDACSNYGFVLGEVKILNEDDIIGTYSTLDMTPYDVFQYLSDISQSIWITKLVDENTISINFYDPTLMPKGKQIDYTNEFWEQEQIKDISYNYSSRDYRNKQIMTSDDVFAETTTKETVYSNGYDTIYNTQYKIGLINSIKVNGINATFITREEQEQGFTAQFIYNPSDSSFESTNVYSTGTIIELEYKALISGRQVVYNTTEVERITNSINRKGVIARYENRNDVLSSEELQKIGQSYIKYKGKPEINLTVQTINNNLYNIGEVVYFDAPLDELKDDYMVKEKNIQSIIIDGEQFIIYTFTLSSNFNAETDINYFDNQRSKAKGNISAGEFITRNIDIENSINIIFYDLEINEITITNDNVLNGGLNMPFTK